VKVARGSIVRTAGETVNCGPWRWANAKRASADLDSTTRPFRCLPAIRFYARLNAILDEAGFDRFAEEQCQRSTRR